MPELLGIAVTLLILSVAMNFVMAFRIRRLEDLIAPFDHDHDGRPGG